VIARPSLEHAAEAAGDCTQLVRDAAPVAERRAEPSGNASQVVFDSTKAVRDADQRRSDAAEVDVDAAVVVHMVSSPTRIGLAAGNVSGRVAREADPRRRWLHGGLSALPCAAMTRSSWSLRWTCPRTERRSRSACPPATTRSCATVKKLALHRAACLDAIDVFLASESNLALIS
jgi:hypothetical protein